MFLSKYLFQLFNSGSGNFGKVYGGVVTQTGKKTKLKVAIKSTKDSFFDVHFYKEAITISQLEHPNIIKLIGICIERHYIITELIEGPQLLVFLRSASGKELRFYDMVQMGCDIAKGCAYLEEMKFIHGDLAARNCMLTSTSRKKRVVKIGDFGLSKDIYGKTYYPTGSDGQLPIRWMAPESMEDNILSAKTDVWSFGVLMWEIMTLGMWYKTNWNRNTNKQAYYI